MCVQDSYKHFSGYSMAELTMLSYHKLLQMCPAWSAKSKPAFNAAAFAADVVMSSTLTTSKAWQPTR